MLASPAPVSAAPPPRLALLAPTPLPRYVEEVLHHCVGRLRIRLSSEARELPQEEGGIAKLLEAQRGTRRVRLNRFADCCVVELEPAFAAQPLEWLYQLPADLAGLKRQIGRAHV